MFLALKRYVRPFYIMKPPKGEIMAKEKSVERIFLETKTNEIVKKLRKGVNGSVILREYGFNDVKKYAGIITDIKKANGITLKRTRRKSSEVTKTTKVVKTSNYDIMMEILKQNAQILAKLG